MRSAALLSLSFAASPARHEAPLPDMPPLLRPAGRRSVAIEARDYDRRRRAESATRALYGTAAWRTLRDDQLAREPWCRFHRQRGEFASASVCDHVHPHNGDVAKFWAGPFQSLCEPCHNGPKQAAEAAGRQSPTRRR